MNASLRCMAVFTLALAGAAFAQGSRFADDPPPRAGALSDTDGSVVYAPPGETEWADAVRNHPITHGDRVWTDDGARAELHFGSSVLRLASRTFVEAVAIDADAVQLQVNEGAVSARVRDLQRGENFEIDTPNLAVRTSQPGEWRLDVDPQRATTRVEVRSGTAVVYGANGGVQQVVAGQVMTFAKRDLAHAANVRAAVDEGFERWVAERNRAEDESLSAQYIPREVVGYAQLDRYGTWSEDSQYGPVWFPRVASADWAPYRQGHWESITPWGWTWVDDAPWGFAPFHYGRWAMVGTRWCWVPGPLGTRPVYAPALVGVVGGSDVERGWYPLGPGEVWRPLFDASPAYVRNANRDLVTESRFYNNGPHRYMRRPEAITYARADMFRRTRPAQPRYAQPIPPATPRAQNAWR